MSGFIYRKELSSIKVSWPNFCSPILTTRSGNVLINHDKTTQKPAKNNNHGETSFSWNVYKIEASGSFTLKYVVNLRKTC